MTSTLTRDLTCYRMPIGGKHVDSVTDIVPVGTPGPVGRVSAPCS
jgi:hypothetical protein